MRLPLAMLSEADQDFVKDSGETTPVATGEVTLAGKPLARGGKMNVFEIPFSEKALKAFARDKITNEKTIKIAVAVPADSDPPSRKNIMSSTRR